jgi:hypothetical protein
MPRANIFKARMLMSITFFKYLKFLLLFFLTGTIFWSVLMMIPAIYDFGKLNGTPEMLDVIPKKNANSVYSYIKNMDLKNRNFLVHFYRLEDLIYPMFYGPLLVVTLVYYQRKTFPGKKIKPFVLIIPLLMVLFDYLENFTIIRVIQAYPHQLQVASFLPGFTVAKWSFGIIFGVMIMYYTRLLTLKKKSNLQKK